MRLSYYRSQLEKLMAQRNGYLVLALASLIVSLFLAILLYCSMGREKIIIVPPTVTKSFWISASQVSPEYLVEMTYFFAFLRLNLTPDNADRQREILLQYTDPAYYELLKARLVSEADHLTAQHMTFAFYPVDIKVDSRQFKTIITGDLKSQVGSNAMKTERLSYLVSYRYAAGRLLIRSFEEVSHA